MGRLANAARRRLRPLAYRLGLRRPPPAPALDTAWVVPTAEIPGQRIEIFRDLLGLFPAGRLLDLGCGHGAFSIAAQEMGWAVVGVDARTERMPMTPGVEWVQHDVRTYDVTGFDAIALLGLLYHLELPDQLDLLRRCSSTVTILDTHHSNRPTHREGGYAGHTFLELPPDRAHEQAATPTAAWGNPTAFWATQPDLVRMLHDCGYGRVVAVLPPTGRDRTFYLCLPKGQEASVDTLIPRPRGLPQQ